MQAKVKGTVKKNDKESAEYAELRKELEKSAALRRPKYALRNDRIVAIDDRGKVAKTDMAQAELPAEYINNYKDSMH